MLTKLHLINNTSNNSLVLGLNLFVAGVFVLVQHDLAWSLLSSLQVFNILAHRHTMTEHPPEDPVSGQRARKRLCFLGHSICVAGLGRLLGIGTSRTFKMRKAINLKLECPGDGRFLAKAKHFGDRRQTHKREVVHDFLHYLYNHVAESMPEIVARTCDERQIVQVEPSCKALRLARLKGKRPRLQIKRDKQLSAASSKAVRQLPPGNYADYHRMMVSKYPDEGITLKLFMRVPQSFKIGK